jgi:hypothetical protein
MPWSRKTLIGATAAWPKRAVSGAQSLVNLML